MSHRSCWRVSGAVWAFVVALALAGGGCGRDQGRLTWAASGVQLTRLEMPLGGDLHTFMVGEYVLEGQEQAGPGARAFRDRLLLTTYFLGDRGQVWGYGTRTYASGATRAFRLSGTFNRGQWGPELIVVNTWVHSVDADGLGADRPTAWVVLRLDPASGRISVEAP